MPLISACLRNNIIIINVVYKVSTAYYKQFYSTLATHLTIHDNNLSLNVLSHPSHI